ncbi:MAG: aminotransferase class I/II-fold pyridoxal phosphate-dependent enzyme, partial [Deltaproteobacteria bacterium]|nr:aminotransferase class I/II-fold pyridoxal phosphate-dependent enzyme [Deltaproteobacteria bacterium]
MDVRPSSRLASLSGYPFAEVDRKVAELRAAGHRPIDFGVGDPTDPTPVAVREAIKAAVDRRAGDGYPSYVGAPEYRQAISAWFGRRFGVALDPATEVCANIGAKEAVFNFPNALIDPGDVVLCPSPGYPPYARGTLFAGGVPRFYPLRMEDGFLPDLDAIPPSVLARARLIWVNYPNSPSGRIAPDDFWPRLLAFAERWGIVVASDEAYSEIWYDRPPRSALEFGRDGVVVFQSLSKRSNMTGHRVGWVCGDARVVDLFRRLKTNVDSGTATYVQDGAIAALADETHVEAQRASYKAKRDLIVAALRDAGCTVPAPEATLYVWPRVPEGMTGLDFAKRLLDPAVCVVTTPGAAVCEPLEDGSNPGERHVRFAMVPSP